MLLPCLSMNQLSGAGVRLDVHLKINSRKYESLQHYNRMIQVTGEEAVRGVAAPLAAFTSCQPHHWRIRAACVTTE